MRITANMLQQRLYIPDIVDQIGQDDHVERFFGSERQTVGADEIELWMALFGALDHVG